MKLFFVLLLILLIETVVINYTSLGIIHGKSMNYCYVAFLNKNEVCHVGDVCAYRSEIYDVNIFHRVVREAKVYNVTLLTFKGDNNKYVDEERIQQTRTLGKIIWGLTCDNGNI